MKRLLPAAVVLAFLILPQVVSAQYYDARQLAKVEQIKVIVEDGASDDGCLPSPNVLKVEAELILRRSGIDVTDESDRTAHALYISPVGFMIRPDSFGASNGKIQVELRRYETFRGQGEGLVLYFLNEDDWVVRKDIRTVVNKMTTTLANEILKARAAN